MAKQISTIDTDGVITDIIMVDDDYSLSSSEKINYCQSVGETWSQDTQDEFLELQNAIANREARNKLLAECDWTQMSDSNLSANTQAEWATYRQELRDMPSSNSFVTTSPEWPIRPDSDYSRIQFDADGQPVFHSDGIRILDVDGNPLEYPLNI